MEYYVDFHVVADPDLGISEGVVMSALANKFHRWVVSSEDNEGKVAISLPRHKNKPASTGDIMRFHGSKEVLDRLVDEQHVWCPSIAGHLWISPVRPVPEDHDWRVVIRKRINGSRYKRKKAFLMSRHGYSEDEADQHIREHNSNLLCGDRFKKENTPFFMIKSLSTGQNFQFFVDHLKPTKEQRMEKTGKPNVYGITNGKGKQPVLVPWF